MFFVCFRFYITGSDGEIVNGSKNSVSSHHMWLFESPFDWDKLYKKEYPLSWRVVDMDKTVHWRLPKYKPFSSIFKWVLRIKRNYFVIANVLHSITRLAPNRMLLQVEICSFSYANIDAFLTETSIRIILQNELFLESFVGTTSKKMLIIHELIYNQCFYSNC